MPTNVLFLFQLLFLTTVDNLSYIIWKESFTIIISPFIHNCIIIYVFVMMNIIESALYNQNLISLMGSKLLVR